MSFGGGMFEGALAGAQQASQDWSGLTQAAGEGKLLLEPGVAEQCAKHCEDMIEKLDEHFYAVEQMAWSVNMGECNIGQSLGRKFNQKGVGGSVNSVSGVIRQHQKVLTEMATTYRAAGRSFALQEQQNVQVLPGQQ